MAIKKEESSYLFFFLNRVIWISSIFIFAGIPLIINPTAYDYCYKPKIDSLYSLIIIIFVAVFLKNIIFIKSFKFRKTCLFVPLGCYSLSVIVSTFLSVCPELSIKGDVLRYESIFTLLSYVAVVIIFSNIVNREEEVHVLLKLLLFSTFLISLYAIIQYAGFNPTEHFIPEFRQAEHRVGSTIGNPNFLGKLLVLVLPLFIAYFLYSDSNIKKFYFAMGFVLSCLALIFTFTRGSWIGFGASMFLLFFIIPVRMLVSDKAKKILAVSAILFCTVFSAGLYFAEDNVKNSSSFFPMMKYKIRSSFDVEKGMGVATRLFLWKRVVGLIMEKPVFGYGPDTHVKVMRKVNREHNQKFNTDSIIDRAHNNYLDIAIGRGLFGLGAYLSVVVVFMVWLWKTMKREMERSRKILFCCIFSAFFGYLINDLFIFSVVSVSPTFWSLMGLTLTIKHFNNH
jgi:putative inorganic carbon (HCO3(-)) transporter